MGADEIGSVLSGTSKRSHGAWSVPLQATASSDTAPSALVTLAIASSRRVESADAERPSHRTAAVAVPISRGTVLPLWLSHRRYTVTAVGPEAAFAARVIS